jgi:hypothetical protein
MDERPGLSVDPLMLTDQHEWVGALLVGRVPHPVPAGDAAWARLIAAAQAEGVGPLLAWALRTHSPVDLPPAAVEQLELIYRGAMAASLRLQSLRTRVCRRLTERSIPVLVLKGAALALTCYEDPATRPMGDLDLLVPSSRLQEAARALEQDDFRPAPLPPSLIPFVNRPHRHLAYAERRTGAIVELHWEVQLPRGALRKALPEIWTHAQPLPIDDPAHAMCPGHAIPYLCAHMTLQHKRASLLWIYDLHRLLLAADTTELHRAERAAAQWGVAAAMAQVLLRVQCLFGTPLSEPLRRWAGEARRGGGLQARVAQLALEPESAGMPHNGVLNLLLDADWRFLRSTLPAPQVLRERCGLSPDQSVIPAYAALLRRHVGRLPAQARQLWRLWRPTTRRRGNTAWPREAAAGGEAPIEAAERRGSTDP